MIKAFIVSLRQIGVAYVTATSTALATAVGLNLYTKVQTHTHNYSYDTECLLFLHKVDFMFFSEFYFWLNLSPNSSG